MSNQSKENELIHIATIGKTVGLKGDMKFHIKSDFPEQFKSGASFLVNKKEKITLEHVNSDKTLIRISGCTSPESARKYTNAKLYTTYEETRKNCNLQEGQFFWFDILGCLVFEDKKCLGSVIEVERIGITDYLSVKTDENLVNAGLSKTFLIPYHAPFILSTDVDTKVIEVSGAVDILEAS